MDNFVDFMSDFCGSEFWDTNLTWNTTNPDFTPCFQHTILAWCPLVFLWIFSFVEIGFILHSQHKASIWSSIFGLKLLLNCILIASCTFDFFQSLSATNEESTSYNFALTITAMLNAISYTISLILLFWTKAVGFNTSGVLFIFWFLEIICGMVQFRTEIYEPNKNWTSYNYLIQYFCVWIIFLANFVSDCNQKHFHQNLKVSPELTSSFISKIWFFWVDSLIWRGLKKPLEVTDLWDLSENNSTKTIVPIFEKQWRKTQDKIKSSNIKNNTKYKASILPALIRCIWKISSVGHLFALIDAINVFVSPLLVNWLIGYVENGNEPQWRGYFYSILLFASCILQGLITGQCYTYLFKSGFRLRTAIISTIYRKVLRISSQSQKEFDSGAIVNLIAVDTEYLALLPPYMYLIWSGPLQIILAVYFLWLLLGPAVVSGLIVMILLIPINSYIAKQRDRLQQAQMQAKDNRIKLTNEIINSIKILKVYAWEECFEKRLLAMRQVELKVMRKMFLFEASTAFTWFCAPFMVSFATFGTYVLWSDENVLTAQNIFVSLALLNVLRYPLNMISTLLTYLIQGRISLGRINKFMNLTEIDSSNTMHDTKESVPLLIENGIFGYDTQIVLNNINLRLKSESLTAIVGNIGSGKSCLINAFLGECQKFNGHVNTVGTIAYVSQQAWIQNATIKENILFGKPCNQIFYEIVIRVCALKADLEILPGGDQTEIGEKGANLSGGQKQRISLARAVYSDADIYFFDDPLSAVDSQVGSYIFEHVIGPNGILKHKTRVLVTHGVTYLPETDLIVVLKNGEISEMGAYQTLRNGTGAFAEFLNEYDQVDNTEETDEESIFDYSEENISSLIDRISTKFNERNVKKQAIRKVKTKFMEDEKIETGNIKFKVYLDFCRATTFYIAILAVLLNIVCQGFGVGGNFWLMAWGDDSNSQKSVDLYISIYGVLGLGQAFTSVLANWFPLLGCWYASRKLHKSMFSSVLHSPMSFFDTTPQGRIMSRFSRDIDIMDTLLPTIVPYAIYSISEIIASLFVISLSTPWFLTVVIPIGFMYLTVQRVYITTSRQLKRLESVMRTPLYSHFSESIVGASLIRTVKAQNRFIRDLEKKLDFYQSCTYPLLLTDRWFELRLVMFGNIVILLASLFAVLARNTINPTTMGLTVNYALEIVSVFYGLGLYVSEFEKNIVAVERINEYGNLAPEASENKSVKCDPPSHWPKNGTITFKNYSVRYRPQMELILQKISFNVKPSEKIGIVGRTGAGKSSITLSLFRILEAAEGEILIDGINIANLSLSALRRHLTIIPQDPVIFSGSLRLNLDPFEQYSDAQIWQVLEQAYLSDYVNGLPKGLNHELSDSSSHLSIGQKQLICLARALLRKTKILILDEATAAVDFETDSLIQTTIRQQFSDCTILTIAHRINTILDSDRVLVLDKGRVVEFDSPDVLLQDETSVFYGIAVDAGVV